MKKCGIAILICILLGVSACQNSVLKLKKETFTINMKEEISVDPSTYIEADKKVLKKTQIDVNTTDSKIISKIYASDGELVAIFIESEGTYDATAKYKDEVVKFKIIVKK